MKIKIQRLISSIVFVVLLILAIGKCAELLEAKESKTKYNDFFESETNYDVILIGSSHMRDSVLSMELWKEYGITSYNWGYSNCTPAINYYLIQDIVKYTSPKVVVIDLFGLVWYERYDNGKYRTDKIEQQHVQFDMLPLTKNKIIGTQDIFDDYNNNEDFLWNFIMYHNRWNELGEQDFNTEISPEKGSHLLAGVGKGYFTEISQDEKIEIDSVCYPYFLKTLEFLSENNIEVLCTYLPYPAEKTQQKISNTIGEVIEQYPGCSYVNMLYEDILDFSTDMWTDNHHLNYSGACKTTSWLGNYLANNYDLDDYSEHPAWIEDYEEYYEFKVEKLKEQTLLVEVLSLLYDSDFDAEIELCVQTLQNSERIKKLLQNIGVEATFNKSEKNYAAKVIIKNSHTGEVIDEQRYSYYSNSLYDIELIE